VVTTQYNAVGSPVNVLTETFVYVGNKITNIIAVKTIENLSRDVLIYAKL
jgi:hypothetical protein